MVNNNYKWSHNNLQTFFKIYLLQWCLVVGLVEHLPSAQVMIPVSWGSWDQLCIRLPAPPGACHSLILSLCCCSLNLCSLCPNNNKIFLKKYLLYKQNRRIRQECNRVTSSESFTSFIYFYI